MNTEPLKTLQVTDDYALVVMKIRRIKYTAPISKKQMKKNPQSEDIQEFREYNFFLQGYFEAAHDYAYAILETCPPGGQCIFNFVSQYDTLRYPLDLERNTMLQKHVSKVLGNSEPIIEDEDDEGSCHSPISTASISSHASSYPLQLHENADSDSRLPSTSSSRTSSKFESYENENIQDDPQSVTPILYHTPPLPPRSTGSSRVASSASNQRFETPNSTYYSPSTTPIPFSAASTCPYSSAAASIHSQNGIANQRSQNLSSSIPNQRINSPTNSDISERMNNVQLVQTSRKPFPQSGVPRYRNMCLYERSEHISPRLAVILDQMDSYLTNPVPPITTSIKKKSSDENKMPEFEKCVAKFLD
uniref:Uncharacterized protein n=1 Tax=Panagrolaimus sp. PS1159 TaxID=55785 RepID=A0AC35FGX9_9BILA